MCVAVAVGVFAIAASVTARRGLPPPQFGQIEAEGSFKPGGEYPGEPLALQPKPRTWGSWSGADANTGTLRIGPFPAPATLRLAVSGYPHQRGGNALYLEMADLGLQLPLPIGEVGERWQVEDFDVPFGWRGRRVTLVAVDGSRDLTGWLGVSEPLPLPGGRTLEHGFTITLAAWLANGLLLALCFVTAARRFARAAWLPQQWLPLAAAAVVALLGYGAFWAFFTGPTIGRAFSFTVLGAALLAWMRAEPETSARTEWRGVGWLAATIGLFYLALLHVFAVPRDFYDLAANRFVTSLPGDNRLPHDIAVRLLYGDSLKELSADWLSSDRPPLQSGWQLLTWPALALLGFGETTVTGTSAVWLQLLWVAAGYGLLCTLRLPPRRALAWTAAFSLSGFFLQNTIFTWPKLSAGAFVCGAFACWFLGNRTKQRTGAPSDDVPEAALAISPAASGENRPPCSASAATQTALRSRYALGAVFAALAWLSHGGVAFSLLALVPWAAWRFVRGEGRRWALAAGVFAIVALPWFAYQRFYDPPANRLLKWHLGGQIEKDARGTWETIRENYAALTPEELRGMKLYNFRLQVTGDWPALFDASKSGAATRREDEFYHTSRAFGWSLLGLGLLGVSIARRNPNRREMLGSAPRTLVLWVLATLLVWCLLMFLPTAVIMHGSYAVEIAGFAVLAAWTEAAGRRWIVLVAALQGFTLLTTWAIGNDVVNGRADRIALAFAMAGAAALATVVARSFRGEIVRPGGKSSAAGADVDGAAAVARASTAAFSPQPMRSGIASHLAQWWREPRVTWWVLLAIAVALYLRKPDALLTPQLWAEDGSIFLAFNDLDGLRALVTPYMGYLHTIPRLIAWSASRLLDPAWWPAFYNVVSFALWIAVIARTFSPRLQLPGKPWLALAFFFGPQTGEILFNITNLQWITAFVFVQQALMTAPSNRTERIGDLLLLALVGLTGPFAIAFVPLFAWRGWRERDRASLAMLFVVGACAAVQAWFIMRTGPRFDHQSLPVDVVNGFVVLVRRLAFWPVLGERLALDAPAALVGGSGLLLGAAFITWVLRPHPRRALRLQVLAALALMLAAAFYRTRADTWRDDNLVFSDRYFYMPRVLLAWLLVWEFDARPRFPAFAAATLYAAAVFVHLPNYILPAPANYRWAEHCDPIRRGEPANIPILPEGWTLEYRGRPQKH